MKIPNTKLKRAPIQIILWFLIAFTIINILESFFDFGIFGPFAIWFVPTSTFTLAIALLFERNFITDRFGIKKPKGVYNTFVVVVALIGGIIPLLSLLTATTEFVGIFEPIIPFVLSAILVFFVIDAIWYK